MRKYITKRILMMIPMLVGISFILFIIMHLAPGDPASIRYGLNPEISDAARSSFDEMYGLDKPLLKQYSEWMIRLVRLDFGNSLIDDKPVVEKIVERLPATLILQISSLVIIFSIAVPLGVAGAVKKDTFFDRIMTILVFTGYAMPGFWLALLLIFFFGFKLQWFPVSGMAPWYTSHMSYPEALKDLLWHMVLPVTATSFGSLAALSRYTRSSTLEALKGQYVLTARAKGLTDRRIICVHVLRNSLLPVITILGMTLPALISGSFVFETIFAWPGMGRLGYESVMSYDYPVVMGVGVIATFLTLSGMLISDVLYAVVDPRIRVEK